MSPMCRRPRALEIVALIPAVGVASVLLLPGDTTSRAQSWDVARQLFQNELGVGIDWWILAVIQLACFLNPCRWQTAPSIGALAGLSHWLFYAVAFTWANPIGTGGPISFGFAVANGCALYLNIGRRRA